MDVSNLSPEELAQLKETINSELASRSSKMLDDLDNLLGKVREMRLVMGVSKALVLKRLFPVVEGEGRGRGRRKADEDQSTESDAGETEVQS